MEQYLRELINYYKNMHTKSDNKEIMTGSDTNEIIEELFESFLQRYEQNLEFRF